MTWKDYGVECDRPVIGGIYRHFKGGVYQVVDIVKDADDGKTEYVIYKSLIFGERWMRRVSEFMSDVDAEKYPEFAGQKRLELVGLPQNLVK